MLSGGERGRLMLARALAKPSNLLVLDEPTNDLDLETLDVLEEMLGDYAGTVILISHDRDFLDRVVNAVIVPRGRRPLGRICRRLQRHAGAARRAISRASRQAVGDRRRRRTEATRAAARAASRGKRRLSFHEKHALETLPKHDRRAAGARSRRCTTGSTIRRSTRATARRSRTASAALAGAQAELAAAEEKWLELEILREERRGRVIPGQTAFTLFPERVSVALRTCFARRPAVLE